MGEVSRNRQSEDKPETALIEYGGFLVAGLSARVSGSDDFSALWRKLYAGLGAERQRVAEKLQAVGLMMPDESDTGFIYTAGFMVREVGAVAALGLTGTVVPASLYATVMVSGAVPGAIKPGFDYLHSVFIPSKGLTPTGVSLEVYGPGDMKSEDYRMYCWCAVTGAPVPAVGEE